MEEKMTVLRMLERGIINADEAERLILALSNNPKKDSTFDKAGDAIASFAKDVGETAEKIAKTAEPKIKKVIGDISDKAKELKAYAERKIEERKQEKENKNNGCGCGCGDHYDKKPLDDDSCDCCDTQDEYIEKVSNMIENAKENEHIIDMMEATLDEECDSCIDDDDDK